MVAIRVRVVVIRGEVAIDVRLTNIAGAVCGQLNVTKKTRETDEDDAEKHDYIHFHQTRGRGGHYHTRQV